MMPTAATSPQVAVGLGRLLSFEAVAGNAGRSTPVGSVLFLGFNVLWVALLVVGLSFLLRWIMVGAELWTGVATTRRSLRLALVSSLIAASGLLALWFGLLFLFRDFAESALLPVASLAKAFDSVLVFMPNVLFFLVSEALFLSVLIFLWAFPLAACLRRNRADAPTVPGWAFLDSSSR